MFTMATATVVAHEYPIRLGDLCSNTMPRTLRVHTITCPTNPSVPGPFEEILSP